MGTLLKFLHYYLSKNLSVSDTFNRTAVKYANGIVVTYDYDALNRLISEKALDNIYRTERSSVMNYYIGVCKICHQGYLQIVKDIETNQLYVYCDDCEAEWSNPEDAILYHNGSREKYGLISYPNYDEICNIGWEKYIK